MSTMSSIRRKLDNYDFQKVKSKTPIETKITKLEIPEDRCPHGVIKGIVCTICHPDALKS